MNQLNEIKKADYSKLTSLFRDASQLVSCSVDFLEGACADLNHLEQIKEMLAGLPLTTEEAALAKQRLINGQAYAAVGENGAAGYELKQLARSLKSRPTAKVRIFKPGQHRGLKRRESPI